ncbi:MAG: 2-phospho-L-lactate transferase [Steroidobacteraceae bacterium]
MKARILALSGGVGGAKLARGLARVLGAGELCVACNTGDDFTHLDLAIWPDLDSVTYAVAGLADDERGWGRRGETWQFMAALRELGGPDWFRLGDQDLALHVWRSARLRAGARPSELAADVCARLGIAQTLLPMTDDTVRTRLHTDAGLLDFQDYFVARRAQPRVERIEYVGAATAGLPGPLSQAIAAGWQPEAVLLCPSNPWLSIDPILAIPAWRDWLSGLDCPIVGVSPIVGGQALKGCAAKLMAEFGLEVSAAAVARHYGALLDGFVIDRVDQALATSLRADGLGIATCDTVMRGDTDRERVACAALDLAAELRRGGA